MQPEGAVRRDDDDTLRAGLPSEREQDALVLELRVGSIKAMRGSSPTLVTPSAPVTSVATLERRPPREP